MSTGAEPALPLSPDRATATVTPIRSIPLTPDPAAEARERLVRRLAADRVRDLRDEGVTVAYMARMYDVDAADFQEVIASLGGGMR